jgi:hypothetical protein
MSVPVFSIILINGSVRAGIHTMASALVAGELRRDPAVNVEIRRSRRS